MNIKYGYLCNSEHITSNMKQRTRNMKLERKHKTRAKKKNFGVFGKSVYETLNKKDEINYLKHATINIKYDYHCNNEHETSNMKHLAENMKLECKHKMEAKKKNFRIFRKQYMKN